jgi:hypothetical protein
MHTKKYLQTDLAFEHLPCWNSLQPFFIAKFGNERKRKMLSTLHCITKQQHQLHTRRKKEKKKKKNMLLIITDTEDK